jgi:hypothetical protein
MPEHRFRKGDIVKFETGLRTIQGVVKEERGPLGIKDDLGLVIGDFGFEL